jgi:hypothetical protein
MKYYSLDMHNSQRLRCHDYYILYGGSPYFRVLSTEFASCHSSGTLAFEVALDFLKICAPMPFTNQGDIHNIVIKIMKNLAVQMYKEWNVNKLNKKNTTS